MAKLGEKELMEGLKQGAIVGVGIAIITALAPVVPYANDLFGMLPTFALGPVSLNLMLVGEAILAAIGGNYIVSLFK